MSLYLIAYPELATEHVDWIQAIRSLHDSSHPNIDPHFTLVFAIEKLAAKKFWLHAEPILRNSAPIGFTLRHAMPHIDHGPEALVFLTPDEGAKALRGLHVRLYTGPLEHHLDPERPFVPHMTVARMKNADAARALAVTLEQAGIAIPGRIVSVALVEPGDGGIRVLARAGLGSHQTSSSPK